MTLMNPAESVLYPTSYYRDMASFTTRFISHRFDEKSRPNYDTSVLINSALGTTCSEFESHIYKITLRTFQLAECDESLPIATVVLLDLLENLSVSSLAQQSKDKFDPVLILPPYPSDKYVDFFMGAFMLAYRLLSRNRYPLEAERWCRILGGQLSEKEVIQLEDRFYDLLERHINSYLPPKFRKEDDHTRVVYAQKEIFTVPANPFIPSIRYMKTKLVMYDYVRIRMRLRGQQPLVLEPAIRGKMILDLSVAYPPCHQEMVFRQMMLENVRVSIKGMKMASDREVYLFVMGKRLRTEERYDQILFSSIGLGYNIPELVDLERHKARSRRIVKRPELKLPDSVVVS